MQPDGKSLESFGQAIDSARRLDIPSAAGSLVRSLLQFYAQPEHQAFLAGAFLGAAASHRMRTGPALVVTFITGLTAERAYRTMREAGGQLGELAAAARAWQLTTAADPGDADPAQP